jgi:hypothetical protein
MLYGLLNLLFPNFSLVRPSFLVVLIRSHSDGRVRNQVLKVTIPWSPIFVLSQIQFLMSTISGWFYESFQVDFISSSRQYSNSITEGNQPVLCYLCDFPISDWY